MWLLELQNTESPREPCVELPGLYALTGCDSTNFMRGIGKEKVYKIFEQNEVYTDAFLLLGDFELVPPNVINLLEQFVCQLYNFPEDKDINEVKYQRFISQTKKKINPETLPLIKNEFFLPIKRSKYEINDEISIPITPCNTASSRSWLLIITSCKYKKGRCGNQRCKGGNVGLLCSNVCNCID